MKPNQYPPHMRALIEAQGVKLPKPNKFGAAKTEFGGRVYDSRAEANYAAQLAVRRDAQNGDIGDFLTQVPITLSGGIVYRVDFAEIFRDKTVRLVEIKGHETKEWRMKMRLLEHERPFLASLLDVVKK